VHYHKLSKYRSDEEDEGWFFLQKLACWLRAKTLGKLLLTSWHMPSPARRQSCRPLLVTTDDIIISITQLAAYQHNTNGNNIFMGSLS
jgi:hypothetical protein